MASLLAQVRIPYVSNLAEDVTINSFSFMTVDTGDATLTTIRTRLLDFYNGVSAPATNSIAQELSAVCNSAQSRLKIYNRAHGVPRAPIYDALLPINPPNSGQGFPEEVALCLSFRGPLLSGQVPARRRGRVYIGPLQASDSYTEADGRIRPQTTLRNSLLAAGKRLMDATDASVDWVVHSDVSPAASADTTVVHCWVDNAWDTQRRRGGAATVRTGVDRSGTLP